MNAKDVLLRYTTEHLPEFADRVLSDVNQRGLFGDTPLHVAATRGIEEEISALIREGAEVNARGEFGNTPLHDAVLQGNVQAVRILLAAGARMLELNEDGDSPVSLSTSSDIQEIARIFSGLREQE
jgi:uncharacterized protein